MPEIKEDLLDEENEWKAISFLIDGTREISSHGKNKTEARGIGLKKSEWRIIDSIAENMNITPHAVIAYGARYFMKDWKAGKIKIKEKIKKFKVFEE